VWLHTHFRQKTIVKTCVGGGGAGKFGSGCTETVNNTVDGFIANAESLGLVGLLQVECSLPIA
jgi:hypothetical protein